MWSFNQFSLETNLWAIFPAKKWAKEEMFEFWDNSENIHGNTSARDGNNVCIYLWKYHFYWETEWATSELGEYRNNWKGCSAHFKRIKWDMTEKLFYLEMCNRFQEEWVLLLSWHLWKVVFFSFRSRMGFIKRNSM